VCNGILMKKSLKYLDKSSLLFSLSDFPNATRALITPTLTSFSTLWLIYGSLSCQNTHHLLSVLKPAVRKQIILQVAHILLQYIWYHVSAIMLRNSLVKNTSSQNAVTFSCSSGICCFENLASSSNSGSTSFFS